MRQELFLIRSFSTLYFYRSKLFEILMSFFFEKKVNCGKPFIMSLDNAVNICQIIRLSREKTGFCWMQSLLVISFSKRLGLDLLSLSGSKLLNTLIVCLNVS